VIRRIGKADSGRLPISPPVAAVPPVNILEGYIQQQNTQF